MPKKVADHIWHQPSKELENRDKSRGVTYILYPDSVYDGWEEYFRSTNYKIAVSPLHEKDLLESGEVMKPHRHVVVLFPGPMNWANADKIRSDVNLYKNFEKLGSSQDMVNYLTHDSYKSVDKFKYSKDEIIWINCTEADFMEDEYLRIIYFIEDNHIRSLRSLILKLLDLDYEGRMLIKWVTSNTYFCQAYIKSRLSYDYEN